MEILELGLLRGWYCTRGRKTADAETLGKQGGERG
jgi:hypothetical protein